MRISRKLAVGLGIVSRDRVKKTEKEPQGPTTTVKISKETFNQLCASHGLPEPLHEYQFHPTRKWKADYFFGDWLIVERDGGLFGRGKPCPMCKRRPVGAHSSIGQLKKDRERDREAVVMGFGVMRFFPEEFEKGTAFDIIKRAIDARKGN